MRASSGLLLVDLQTITLSNARTLPANELLANVGELLAHYRAAKLPVWHAASTGMPVGRTAHSSGGRTWPVEATAFAESVTPREGEHVVSRAAWSAFAGTDLAASLRARGIEELIIVGLATSFGIESTARDAYDLGFSVVIPRDAVSGPDPEAHNWTLTRVIPLLGTVTTVAELTR